MFDKNYKLLDAAWEAVDPAAEQVGASPVIAHDYLMREYTAKEEGYVFMYVSNENPTLVDVYFDDVVMTYTKSNVIQYNEYYPFGMNTANSWTRENVTGNNFLGNGGTEFNNTSNLYDLDYRNYDPILGRMNGIDPMATKYASLSPYNFSFNDPVTFNDPSGADPYQRSDDTWWVASRESLAGGRYTGFSSLNDFLRENRSSGVFGNDDPWAWTGMSSGEMYGEGIGRFGAGYLPGEFSGTAQDKEEIWIDYYVKENGNYIDSEFKGYRYTDRKQNRERQQERDYYVQRTQEFELSAGVGVVGGDKEGRVKTLLVATYSMKLSVSVFKASKFENGRINSIWVAKISAVSHVSASAGEIITKGVVTLKLGDKVLEEVTLGPPKYPLMPGYKGQYSYVGESYIELPKSFDVSVSFLGTWMIENYGQRQVPVSLRQPGGVNVSQIVKLN